MERSVAGILLHQGKAFVARRGQDGSFGGRWEFPGGKVEPGERDEEAVAREFNEEFGVHVDALRLLGEVVFPHRGIDRTLAAYQIEMECYKRPKLLEHEAIAWVSAEELSALDLVDSDRDLLPYVLPLMS
jgi:8-oxo-dGTP diphosphatase